MSGDPVKNKVVTVALIIIVVFATPIAICKYIPESYTRSTNYYDVTGEPHIIATLVGGGEFDRGEDAVLTITLQNYGAIYRIKGDEYLNSSEQDYDGMTELAEIELGAELKKSGAYRVNVLLLADGVPAEVMVDVQEIESIGAGETGIAKFPIHIDDNAPAGVYQLRLKACYDHIQNVQMSGTPMTPDINYWNKTGEQNQTIVIVVKKESDFEVTDVASDLQVGGTGFLNVTYRNTGEDAATDAIARISDMLPFTAVANSERLGTIVPGESVTAHFRVSTDRSAVPKVYSISTGIRFKDEDGDIRISDPMQIGVVVAPKVPFSEKIMAKKWWILAAAPLLAVLAGLLAWGGLGRKRSGN